MIERKDCAQDRAVSLRPHIGRLLGRSGSIGRPKIPGCGKVAEQLVGEVEIGRKALERHTAASLVDVRMMAELMSCIDYAFQLRIGTDMTADDEKNCGDVVFFENCQYRRCCIRGAIVDGEKEPLAVGIATKANVRSRPG